MSNMILSKKVIDSVLKNTPWGEDLTDFHVVNTAVTDFSETLFQITAVIYDNADFLDLLQHGDTAAQRTLVIEWAKEFEDNHSQNNEHGDWLEAIEWFVTGKMADLETERDL